MIRARVEQGYRAWERYRARRHAHGVILIYHRVAEPATDPWGIAVSPDNFAAHMEVARTYAVPRTQGDFADRLDAATGPERSIVVTFDDGYADNLTALPILEANEVPATVFVVSGAVGKPDAFWWDLLTRIFLEAPVLPQHLALDLPAGRTTYDLGDAARYDGATLLHAARWRADLEPPQDARQRTYLDVWKRLLGLSPGEIAAAAEALATWAGLPGPAPAEGEGRPMTSGELATLAASPLIEIGGHTRTHADLARLTRAEAADEIGGGRCDLVEMTGRPVRSFACPYGRMGPHTVADIRSAGFTNASCSRFGLASGRDDALALPRVHVPNMPAETFERLIAGVLGRPARSGARR
jgi:peptidoglycan/xylan/chitin deacetylase (PgdA/CDA1 family)